MLQGTQGQVEPNPKGDLRLRTPLSMGKNLDTKLYEWNMENYESRESNF